MDEENLIEHIQVTASATRLEEIAKEIHNIRDLKFGEQRGFKVLYLDDSIDMREDGTQKPRACISPKFDEEAENIPRVVLPKKIEWIQYDESQGELSFHTREYSYTIKRR